MTGKAEHMTLLNQNNQLLTVPKPGQELVFCAFAADRYTVSALSAVDVVQDIVCDRRIKQTVDLLRVAGLTEDPHELSADGLGGHVEGLQNLRRMPDLIADLIHADVAALVLHLCGQDDGFPGLDALLERVQKAASGLAGDAADAEALKNQRVVLL